MSKIKQTASKLKFDGMTFLHWSKADETNSFMKESASVNGIKYFKMKEGVTVTVTEEDDLVDTVFTLPTADEIEVLESNKLVITPDGSLEEATEATRPRIKEHSSGKKMKASYLNPDTGNYCSYVRWLQIKHKHPGFWDKK
jgi:hypothetical protein